MSDLPELLRYIVMEMAQGARWPDNDADICQRAATEIERLQSIAGAVSPGQSVTDIKEHLRSLKQELHRFALGVTVTESGGKEQTNSRDPNGR